METLVIDRANASYLVNVARIARKPQDVAAAGTDVAAEDEWNLEDGSPFVTWIGGDFVEADKPNSNKQFWTAGDLELAEYSIKHAPLNMVHKFRQPVGFFAATRTVKLDRALTIVGDDKAAATTKTGSMKIQALSGLWSHIFPFEAALAEAADERGLLFYSMECRGTHLECAGDSGCGQTFDYLDSDSHCSHLKERSSIRHIISPTFRGGALIVPPTRPGWKEARASIVTDAVMQEAAAFAEQNEAAYNSLEADGRTLTASGWEQLMAMVVATLPPLPSN